MDQTLIGDEVLIVWINVILAFAALEECGFWPLLQSERRGGEGSMNGD